jgi:hypothetical protein
MVKNLKTEITMNADYRNVRTTTKLKLISYTKSVVQDIAPWIKKCPTFIETKRPTAVCYWSLT